VLTSHQDDGAPWGQRTAEPVDGWVACDVEDQVVAPVAVGPVVAGDIMEVTVEGIGTLINPVIDE